ncbi:glycosyltransferase family 15 protein [Neoconidiobolus thromboides FSU 785]|nr:glycosyltransferase family 15 protein [Neoconidiobolus thromboides FSU 785]
MTISVYLIFNTTNYKQVEGLKQIIHFNNTERENACFLILIRNKELKDFKRSMKQLEDRFNKHYNYPYVFLNDVPFTSDFKEQVQALTSAEVEFGLIPKEHWGIPSFINETKAKQSWEQMASDGVLYGGSESYRHMCRFESGFFYRHELVQKYDYYWRVEPEVQFSCDLQFDPFRYMRENNKLYGFTIALYEFEQTIPTLWKTVNEWIKKFNIKLPEDNAISFISDDKGETYNLCHFWTNFEIASFDLWRDKQYLDYFTYLDQSGGFFYERWGDAPVHSIYAALTLPKDKIHFFNEIGYFHSPFTHCPIQSELNKFCHCDVNDNFDNEDYSCTKKWIEISQAN